MIDFLLNNLDHMAPIIGLGIFAIAIIVERLRSLYIVYPISTQAFFDRIRSLVLQDNISDAVAICEKYYKKPVAQVVKEGLIRAHQPHEIVEHGLVAAAGDASDRVKARTGYLSMIANVSTLLGLIGTILGLVQSFEAVGSANAAQRSALLAQGISVAMNHTLWGLTVAVPCMVLYSFLMNRSNKLKADLDRAIVRTMEIIKQRDVIASDNFNGRDNHPRRAA